MTMFSNGVYITRRNHTILQWIARAQNDQEKDGQEPLTGINHLVDLWIGEKLAKDYPWFIKRFEERERFDEETKKGEKKNA